MWRFAAWPWVQAMNTDHTGNPADNEFDMDAIRAFPEFDVADYLGSDKEIAAFVNIFLEEEDVTMLVHALGTVVRARSKAGMPLRCAVGHEALYKALCEESAPRLDTVMRVMKSLGLRLAVEHIGTAGNPALSGETPAVP